MRLIADHVLEEYTNLHGTGARRLGESSQLLLSAYSWPGNVRELRHVIERAVLMTDRAVIRADDLIIDRRTYAAATLTPPSNSGIRLDDQGAISVEFPPQGIALEAVERELIRAALERSGNNVTKAAALLHVSRDTLRYRISNTVPPRPANDQSPEHPIKNSASLHLTSKCADKPPSSGAYTPIFGAK